MSAVERAVPVETPAVTEADVLRRAADLLEEFGWCQGALGMPHNHCSDRGAYCFAGGIAGAARDLGFADGSTSYLLAAHVLGVDMAAITDAVGWNDAPGRTMQEVVQRLREAAEAASC